MIQYLGSRGAWKTARAQGQPHPPDGRRARAGDGLGPLSVVRLGEAAAAPLHLQLAATVRAGFVKASCRPAAHCRARRTWRAGTRNGHAPSGPEPRAGPPGARPAGCHGSVGGPRDGRARHWQAVACRRPARVRAATGRQRGAGNGAGLIGRTGAGSVVASHPGAAAAWCRVVDLTLSAAGRPAGWRVGDLNWPRSALLLAVRHNGEAFEASEHTQRRPGDCLTVLGSGWPG